MLAVVGDSPLVDHQLRARLADLVRLAVSEHGVVDPYECTIHLVEPMEMARLNEEHLGAEGPTDVLSFPIDGTGTIEGPWRVLGDIFLCPDVAAAQHADHAGTFEDECALLVVHSALHLLGFDHAEPGARAEMWQAERMLIERHWGQFTRDPWTADV